MKYFVRHALEWLTFLALTVLFFSLPVVIERHGSVKDIRPRQASVDSTTAQIAAGFFFEFDIGSVKSEVAGDSISLKMITRTDTSRKLVDLYVNGEKQDMVVISDSMPVLFPRVYLKTGPNEIVAILRDLNGMPLATRKIRIFSQSKM